MTISPTTLTLDRDSPVSLLRVSLEHLSKGSFACVGFRSVCVSIKVHIKSAQLGRKNPSVAYSRPVASATPTSEPVLLASLARTNLYAPA